MAFDPIEPELMKHEIVSQPCVNSLRSTSLKQSLGQGGFTRSCTTRQFNLHAHPRIWTLSEISISALVPIPAVHTAEVMQATRDHHHDVREAVLEIAQHILHDPTDFHPRQSVLDAHARPRQGTIMPLLAGRQVTLTRLFFGSRSSPPAGW